MNIHHTNQWNRQYKTNTFLIFGSTDCPGTGSEDAGKASACEGCPNKNVCTSLPKGPDPGNNLLNVKTYFKTWHF